jgi:hypothetical protein
MQIHSPNNIHPEVVRAIDQASKVAVRIELLKIAAKKVKINDYDYPSTAADRLATFASELEKYVFRY